MHPGTWKNKLLSFVIYFSPAWRLIKTLNDVFHINIYFLHNCMMIVIRNPTWVWWWCPDRAAPEWGRSWTRRQRESRDGCRWVRPCGRSRSGWSGSSSAEAVSRRRPRSAEVNGKNDRPRDLEFNKFLWDLEFNKACYVIRKDLRVAKKAIFVTHM